MDLVGVESVRVARSDDDLVLRSGEAVIGGGTWMYSEPQPAITGLVDLTGMAWAPLEERGDVLRIGATCTFDELREFDHPLFGPCCDALLGSWKIHRFATVGGNICLALPAGPMTSLFAGLGATAVVRGPEGERTIPVHDLVLGVRSTALAPGEVLRAIDVPAANLRAVSAMRRISLAPLGRSAAFVVGLAAGDELHLVITASTPRPYRLTLPVDAPADGLRAAVSAVGDWYDDPHGAPDWRAAMTLRLAEDVRRELVA